MYLWKPAVQMYLYVHTVLRTKQYYSHAASYHPYAATQIQINNPFPVYM
jgi:hypothetical protein